MKNQEQHIWYFPSKGLKALFDEEIRGQLSDGAWENSMPYKHWYFWSHLKTELGSHWSFYFNPKTSYEERYPQKKTAYNLVGALLDPDVIDLSPRMRAYYVDAEIGSGLGQDADDLVNESGEVMSIECIRVNLRKYSAANDYWKKKLEAFEKFIPHYDNFASAYRDYTRSDLIEDLKLIKKQMKSVIEVTLKN